MQDPLHSRWWTRLTRQSCFVPEPERRPAVPSPPSRKLRQATALWKCFRFSSAHHGSASSLCTAAETICVVWTRRTQLQLSPCPGKSTSRSCGLEDAGDAHTSTPVTRDGATHAARLAPISVESVVLCICPASLLRHMSRCWLCPKAMLRSAWMSHIDLAHFTSLVLETRPIFDSATYVVLSKPPPPPAMEYIINTTNHTAAARVSRVAIVWDHRSRPILMLYSVFQLQLALALRSLEVAILKTS